MVNIVISSGHGKYVRGASGYLDEVNEARKVVERVAEYLRSEDIEVTTFHDNTSHSQSENLNTIVNFHNKQSRDLDVSVHFNAYETTSKPMGTECLYVSQSQLAATVSDAIAASGHLIDRGAKKRTDLFFLNETEEPAILIETCFVDSSADANLYRTHFEAICMAIAETIGDVDIDESEPPPVERPPPVEEGLPAVGVVARVPANDWLNLRASASSSAAMIGKAYNGDQLNLVGQSGNWLKCEIDNGQVVVHAWASSDYVDVTGELPSSGWHEDITATEFGAGSDAQEGAYGNYINSKTRGVALPYKWRDSPRPRVVVSGPKAEVTTDIVDVGPWNIDDPDYVLGSERPMVEEQYAEGTEAQNGLVPTSDAAIDLTAPIAKEVGISGKGKVRWRFEGDVS